MPMPAWTVIISFCLGQLLPDHSPAESASPVGLWFSFEQLRELPLDPAQRLVLQRRLLETPQPVQSAFDLLVDTIQLNVRCCEEALAAADVVTALGYLKELSPLVDTLAAVVADRSEGFWNSYAALLAKVMAALCQALDRDGEAAMEAGQVAELCAEAIPVLQQGLELPVTVPGWLKQLERTLARRGALAGHKHFLATGTEDANRRALLLALRLGELLDPVRPWVAQLCEQLLRPLAETIPAATPFNPEAVAELIGWTDRLPLAEPTRRKVEPLLTRSRLILELLAPELAASSQPQPPEPMAPQPALAVSSVRAALVVLPPGTEPETGQLDLGPLLARDGGIHLEKAGPSAVDDLLDDFCWNLPKGAEALQVSESLVASLEPQWAGGSRWAEEAFGLLSYASAGWQRRLGDKLQPLPLLDWQGGLMVELDSEELAVLVPLLSQPASLEPPLADLRRLHFDPTFWGTRQEVPWMTRLPPLEALRRLHVDHAFYASSHDPLRTLIEWGEGVTEALLASDIWTDDAGGLGGWLAAAQEMVTQGKGPLPLLGQPPPPDRILAELGGMEVVYVGGQLEAVTAAHRNGRLFRGDPFGLRCLPGPDSRHPSRPASSFSVSLAVLLEALDALYRQRPFAVLLADCGAYRLPLLHAAHQRYGVSCLSSGLPMAAWLGGAPSPAPSSRDGQAPYPTQTAHRP